MEKTQITVPLLALIYPDLQMPNILMQRQKNFKPNCN